MVSAMSALVNRPDLLAQCDEATPQKESDEISVDFVDRQEDSL